MNKIWLLPLSLFIASLGTSAGAFLGAIIKGNYWWMPVYSAFLIVSLVMVVNTWKKVKEKGVE